ncbi:MAG TPA: hypothetical protein ENN13_02330, partial [Candidatus Altiarchaeales archaeon]|nr:hypothetical protein [Candidatus Altiarchaeales archaeon]
MDDVKSGQYASRDEAYKNINILVDEALREDKPYFQLSLVSPKKKFVFTQDLPENILDKLLYT